MSRRTKTVVLGALFAALVAVVAVGAVLARSGSRPQGRLVTIPAADRDASRSLVRAAEAVGFHAPTAPGVGEIEGRPASAARPPSTGDLLPVTSKAPPFTLRTPTGKPVSLASLRGRAVLLEFFAAWCPHCAAEAPHLQRLYERLPASRYAFVAVDGASDDAPTVFAYHVWFGLGFPAVLDHGEKTVTFPDHGPLGPVAKRYAVDAYPTFYVLDPSGRIAWRSDGEQPDALLERELRRAAVPG